MKSDSLILNKLDNLKAEINYIKEHLIDITLTQDDLQSIAEAEEDFSKGKTKRLE
jgi:hypothetical protein